MVQNQDIRVDESTIMILIRTGENVSQNDTISVERTLVEAQQKSACSGALVAYGDHGKLPNLTCRNR